MKAVNENDPEQMFWEIRFYARRNGRVHGDAIELRYAGDFKKLLKVLEDDEASLEHILPEEEKRDIHRHRRAIMRYRVRWFEVEAMDAEGKITWIQNAEALSWSKRVGTEGKGRMSKKEDPNDLIRKKVNTVVTNTTEILAAVQRAGEEQSESSGRVLAIGQAMAADPKLAQKPKLEWLD